MSEAEVGPSLKCLGGRRAPVEITRDLKCLTALPKSAKDRFWQALAAVLAEPVPPEADETLKGFCASHAITLRDLAPPLQAARFIVRAASLTNLSPEDFATDLAALTEGDLEIASTLLGGFDASKEILRAEARLSMLRDHGKLYAGLDWRIDLLASSSRGGSLQTPIAVFTFRYTEGKKEKRITLQMPTAAIAELRRVCDQILT